MDLFAVNDGVEPFHANWTLWGMLGDLLTELGCDLSDMSGSNDGERVPGEVAAAWGQTLLNSLDEITVVEYKSSSVFGGVRSQWSLPGSATPVPVSTSEVVRVMVESAFRPDTAKSSLGAESSAEQASAPVVVPLSARPDDRDLLQSFAQFCLASGGFEQY